MSPNDFFSPLEGQSLLIPGQAERFRGQCPQPVGLYVAALGLVFPAYINAYLYWDNGIPGYTKIGAGNPIKAGDIIVWRSDFPPSNGSGHMDVAAQDGTLASFVAWDSNWYPPLKLAKLTHIGNNNNYIAGYLRREDDMYQGKTAEQWATDFTNATNVAEARRKLLGQLESACGVDTGKVDPDQGVDQAVALIDAKNKTIESLETGAVAVTINGKVYIPK